MTQQEIQYFLSNNQKYFNANQIPQIVNMLSDSQINNDIVLVTSAEYKDPTLVLIMAILFGGLAVDRFILGDNVNGVFKVLTFGGLGIWSLIDCVTAFDRAKKKNFEIFMEKFQLQTNMDSYANQQTNNPKLNTSEYILKYKQLLDAGVITEDEYEQKKKELLEKGQ